MTYNDIYLSALALIGESDDSNTTADYRARAPKLLNAVNQRVRMLSGLFLDKASENIPSVDTLDDLFCFDYSLSDAAAHLLAAYLVMDMDHELYSELFLIGSRMLDEMRHIRAEITSTVEVY